MNQYGGGNCSLCGSPGTNKTTCPMNPKAVNPNFAKHPLAQPAKQPAAMQALPAKQSSELPAIPTVPTVPLDIIMSYLDKKSLIAASRVSHTFNNSARHLLKINSIVKNGKLLPLSTLSKMASNGNEDAMVYMASTFQLPPEKYTYPVFRRCFPALFPYSISYRGHEVVEKLLNHTDPAISELATKIMEIKPHEAPDIQPEHKVYIPLYRQDTSVAVYANVLFDGIRKWIIQQDPNLWTPHFTSNLAFLKMAYLFCSIMNTINIYRAQMYSHMLICCYIVMTYSATSPPAPESYLRLMGIVDPSRDDYMEFSTNIAKVLSITPPVVDLAFPNLPDYFGNPQSQEEIDNCNYILDNAFYGIFTSNGIDIKHRMDRKRKKIRI